ncbi:MAG: class A beta-lactamase, subclass A2 [Bacteroidales bacterium]|jgi:beta-lactamase class A/lipopolysaccharide export system protein LptA|nr:class A beta-lactamase, subclass A2 [Bacteroidales bacterium]
MKQDMTENTSCTKHHCTLYKIFLHVCIISVFLFQAISLSAQTDTEVKEIYVSYALGRPAPDISPDAMRLIDSVVMVHGDITMTCDSAYYFSETNRLDAFSRVHIIKSDGSTVDGDFAKYQGDDSFSEIWGNVVLEDQDAIMKTQHLYYDLSTNIAYYVVGADIFNKGNHMVSKKGHYYRDISMFYFKKDVVLNTPDYTIITDTLNYNVQTKIADFVGPTHVVNEKDTIFCELGWYNTNDTVALFRKNAWIKSGSTTVNADTLYYESQTGNGRAFSNIVIVDTTNNIILQGQKGAYNNVSEKAWLTDQAMLIMTGEKDSLFMHSDTLRSDVDTSGFKIMKAYNKVKFYSLDMQGMCDSLAMSLQDSVIRMFTLPVIWSQDNQMTAEYIEIETERQKPKQMNLLNKGFIVSQEDTVGFNQIRGKRIVGFFRDDNELFRVKVFGDGEAIYYVKDGEDYTGVNKSSSPDMDITINDRKAEKVSHLGPSDLELIPENEFNPTELTLTGFNWLVKHRPLDKNEIFHWGERIVMNDEDTLGIVNFAQSETIDSLRNRIKILIQGKKARIGVAIMDSRDNDTLTFDRHFHFPMASVYKYHIALSVLRLVDFGRMKLDQKILVTKEELIPDTHSPLRDEHPEGNVNLTLSELLEYMVSKSDNNACDILLKLMNGPKRVEQIVKSIGVNDISIVNTEQEMHEDAGKMLNNWTTPYSAVKALAILDRQDILSESSRNFLWKLMSTSSVGSDKIKGKLPKTAIVGHKSGSSLRNDEGIKMADNDIGVVRLSGNNHYIIAVFITDSDEDDQANATIIADISRLAWDFYNVKK